MVSTNDGPEADDALFAQNVALFRERSGLSQADLAQRLNELGWKSVYQTTISRIEKADRPVRVGEARMIARALRVDLAQLTLSQAENRQSGRLVYARKRVEDALAAIRDGSVEWHLARQSLLLVIKETLTQGITPSQIPESTDDDPDPYFMPITVSDELALAVVAAKRDPEQQINLGRLLYLGDPRRVAVEPPTLLDSDDSET